MAVKSFYIKKLTIGNRLNQILLPKQHLRGIVRLVAVLRRLVSEFRVGHTARTCVDTLGRSGYKPVSIVKRFID